MMVEVKTLRSAHSSCLEAGKIRGHVTASIGSQSMPLPARLDVVRSGQASASWEGLCCGRWDVETLRRGDFRNGARMAVPTHGPGCDRGKSSTRPRHFESFPWTVFGRRTRPFLEGSRGTKSLTTLSVLAQSHTETRVEPMNFKRSHDCAEHIWAPREDVGKRGRFQESIRVRPVDPCPGARLPQPHMLCARPCHAKLYTLGERC